MTTTSITFEELEQILLNVEKPGRYIGNEQNRVVKEWQDKLSLALVFPDIYEIGMSNLGLKILYHNVNKLDWALAERAFTPWVDMEAEMRREGIPLYSLETYTPLKQFDIVGFTLQYELSYTNILNTLDLAGIAVLSSERGEEDPIIIAGGPNAFTPEPLADYIDVFVVGEGEVVVMDLLEKVQVMKEWGLSREKLLFEMAKIVGVYVPSLYEEKRTEADEYFKLEPKYSIVPERISKRLVKDLNKIDFPTDVIVPNIEIVHDRAFMELFRGCSRGCRFCQAGIIYRPPRARSQKNILKMSQQLIENTGYDELSLTSLSTSDYPGISGLLDKINDCFHNSVSLSLPSLRADSFSVGLANKVQEGKKTGLTFAPEAGSQRLRDVINKQVNEENLMEAARAAFEQGWDKIKLYFMVGLPTETYEDLDGIVDLAYKLIDLYKQVTGKKKLKLNIGTSTFVPKPHTPFQWIGQIDREEVHRRQEYLKRKMKHPAINYNWNDPKPSFLEACLAKGDRCVGKAIYYAYLDGAKFDGWDDQFDFQAWMQSFEQVGIDPQEYVNKDIELDAPVPWQHIDSGITKEFLQREYHNAFAEDITGDCRFSNDGCNFCKICFDKVIDLPKKGWIKQ